jgi:hypothetical protein
MRAGAAYQGPQLSMGLAWQSRSLQASRGESYKCKKRTEGRSLTGTPLILRYVDKSE